MRTTQLLLRSGLTVAAAAALPLALTAAPAAAGGGDLREHQRDPRSR